MELVLLRHGIAVDLNELQTAPRRDEDRPLTKDGRRKVRKAAKGLLALDVKPEVVVHSGLLRAKQTATRVARRLKPQRRKLLVTNALEPHADPHRFLAWLKQQRVKSMVVVGHAPNLDRVVALACGTPGRMLTQLGKAGAIALEVQKSPRPHARVLWLLPPAALRKLG
jgi:phosphohistidine phosphatase